MEPASDCWKPVFCLLEVAGLGTWLAAKDVRQLPGRPKTGKLDCIWLSKAAAHAILAGTGPAMTRFPAPPGTWCPGRNTRPGGKEPAGKKKGKTPRLDHGNAYLARILGNAAAATARARTFPG